MTEQSKVSPANSYLIHQLDPHMKWDDKSTETIKWHLPTNAPFQVSGFPWLEQDGRYRRMPLKPSVAIPATVDQLANCTAGGQIRFGTNSAKLTVRVQLGGFANMYHMPATGQCGFDCYIAIDGKMMYCNTTKYDHTKKEYECVLFDLKKQENRQITLNFPLYQGVEEVLIGLDPDAAIDKPLAYFSNKRVIVYGTSATQGGCAARPGMVYTNILSRRIPLEFINLGFSGNGRGEPEVAQVISEITNPACLVLDYEANGGSLEAIAKTLPEFIRIYRKQHPNVPILVVSKFRFGRELFDKHLLEERLHIQQMERDVVEQYKRQGDQHIHFFDGSKLLGSDFEECTVDGVHPTDLGFLRMADNLEPKLREILTMPILPRLDAGLT